MAATLAAKLALAASAPAQDAAAPQFLAGQAAFFPREGIASPLVVYLPEDYSPDRAWPVVFHYPGTNGRPDVAIPRAFTGGRGFVLVGMEYATRNMTSLQEDYLPIEMATLRAVRDDLAARVRIDPDRVYVGGFSKGGWFAAEFAEVYMRDFAGAYILGAGKSHRRVRNPVAFGPVNKPVYVGTGQLDPNYIYAVRAVEHFRSLGGNVTFDEFLGAGHTMPAGSPEGSAFANWFAVEAAKGGGDSAALAAAVDSWSSGLRERLAGDSPPLTRSLTVERARRNPFFALLDDRRRDELDRLSQPLAAATEVAAEAALRSAYYRLLDDESRLESWDHYRSMAKRYHSLYRDHPQGYFGRRAALDCHRLGALLAMDNRWRFASDAERQKADADAASDPVPTVDARSLTPYFRELAEAIAPY